MRTRFAPSPTGLLHLGHARAAKEAFDYADTRGGECLLRVEDTDHTRCKAPYTQAIFTDLDWLGFDWPLPVRVQSQHYSDYLETVINLLNRELAYPCPLTRSDIKAGLTPDPTFFYSQSQSVEKDTVDRDVVIDIIKTAKLSEKPTLPFTVRLNLKMALSAINDEALFFEETGPLHPGVHDAKNALLKREDPIIARKDIGCSYMIAGPQDDALQNITHVVRGADLFNETPLQILMQSLMDWPKPIYYHHELVLAETGEKLSKRNLDTTLQSLREAGQSQADIWGLIA